MENGVEIRTDDMTCMQVSKVLGVSRQTIYNWIDRGLVPVAKLPNGDYRFRAKDIAKIQEASLPVV